MLRINDCGELRFESLSVKCTYLRLTLVHIGSIPMNGWHHVLTGFAFKFLTNQVKNTMFACNNIFSLFSLLTAMIKP